LSYTDIKKGRFTPVNKKVILSGILVVLSCIMIFGSLTLTHGKVAASGHNTAASTQNKLGVCYLEHDQTNFWMQNPVCDDVLAPDKAIPNAGIDGLKMSLQGTNLKACFTVTYAALPPKGNSCDPNVVVGDLATPINGISVFFSTPQQDKKICYTIVDDKGIPTFACNSQQAKVSAAATTVQSLQVVIIR
jgi:hypothetical protein